ncbi:MAG: SEC-C metal-binding domain-containing protein [Proteobacteria bacterium]|nr:SEC-C metal-binding domain-containing protein [Pseudomonadota bacterium]
MGEMDQRPITRGFIVPLARDPAACSLAAIHAALDGCDLERAVAIALARVLGGQPLTIAELRPLLVRLDDLTLVEDLVAIATGDRAELVDGVGRGPISPEAAARDMLLLYLAWRAGAPRAHVIREARRLARAKLDGPGYVLLAELAAGIADPDLTRATRHVAKMLTTKTRVVLADLDAALARPVGAIVATFPETDDTPRSAGFTLRAAPRPARNEPCACGSGQKYKKCCAGKDEGVAASPVPGLSWEQFITAGADRMTAEDIGKLELPDLVRVDLAKLPKPALVKAFRVFAQDMYWDRATATLDVILDRVDDDDDGYRDELIAELLAYGELDRARVEVDKTDADDGLGGAQRLELDLRQGRADLAAVEAAALVALRTAGPYDIDLAYAVLRASPALGILVARGCLREGRLLDADLLVHAIEDARDQLALPPDDPAWDVLAMLEDRAPASADGDGADDDGDREALRGSLRATTGKIEQLERELTERKRELEAARAAPVAIVPIDPERVRTLKSKIESLEGLVREGNTERGDLRRQLALASRDVADDRAAPTPANANVVDDDDGTELDEAVRGIVIPQFERRVRDALDSVPQQVAAEAMRTIGVLASGDGFAWSRVKQAKDMARQVLMARIGIHHRLLFRVEEGVLDLLDLVTREDLMNTLKRLRANRT